MTLQVASVRLPSDGGRAKGFGYAEFEDRQSLLDALCRSEAVSVKRLYHCSVLTLNSLTARHPVGIRVNPVPCILYDVGFL